VLFNIGHFVWVGMWMGFGMEIAGLLSYLGWRILHGRFADRCSQGHLIHKVHEYFES